MKKVVTYARVSTQEQALKDLSIPAQRKAMVREVASQGAEILAEFVDEGESAYHSALKRDGFQDMIRYACANGVDTVLVHKYDRFSRWKEESTLYKSLLRRAGVTVKSVCEPLDPETPIGVFQECMIEGVAQFQSMNLALETLKGMRENAERGFFNGGKVPFAYRVERSSEIPGQVRGKLVPGPDEEVNLVREIFEMNVSLGMGVKAIANRLNERGVAAPNTEHWSGSTVSHVLHNAVYAGDLVWFKSKQVGRDGRTTTRPEERTIVRDTHPAIIDRATFEKVKVRAKSRSFEDRKSRAKPVGYLLARLIRCDHCGGTFCGRRMNHKLSEDRRSVTFAYYCSSYLNKGKAVCPSFPLSKTWAEGAVLDLIREKLCDPASLAALEGLVAERIEERRRRYGQDTGAVTRKIAETQRQIDNLYKAVGMGMDPGGAIPLINDLKAKKAALEQEAAILAEGDYYADALNANVELLRRFAETFRESFDTLSFEVRRQIMLLFVKEIRLVERRELHVHLRIPFNNRGLNAILESEGEDAGTENDNAEGAGSTQATSACRSGTRWLHETQRSRTTWRVGDGLRVFIIVAFRTCGKAEQNVGVVSPAPARPRTSVLARAREWAALIGRLPGVHNRADLAAHLGVTRARVTQALAPLGVSPGLLAAMEEAEEAGTVISEGVWRRLSVVSEREAVELLSGLRAA